MAKSEITSAPVPAESHSAARPLPACSKCGGESWLKIDGCMVCQSCGFSKCG